MKVILLALFFILSCQSISAQIIVGGDKSIGNSELLSFPKTTATNALTDTRTDNDRGIILPAVDTRPSFVNKASNNGTFIFDKSSKKVLMFENGIWKELSQGSGDIGSLVLNTSAEEGNGVIIGADTTSAEGVLVLESNNKALVLPHIENPHITVKSPYPGMICYDTKSNSLAIFDGAKWNYWR